MNTKTSKSFLNHNKRYYLRSSKLNHFDKSLLNVALNLDKDAFYQNKITPLFPNSSHSKHIHRYIKHIKKYSRQKSISSDITRQSLSSKASYNSKSKDNSTHIQRTKSIITFTEENTQLVYKFNQFKEDEMNLSKVDNSPEIIWMKADNDVMSDDNDIENGREVLFSELEKTIEHIESDSKYLKMNISRMKMKKKGKYSLE